MKYRPVSGGAFMAKDSTDVNQWAMNGERARMMAKRAKGPFSYIYPLLARQMVQDYHICEGNGLDVGCGSASWAIELAKITNLNVMALDISPDMIQVARENVRENELENRVNVIVGDVQKIPFETNHFDLIVSRGSFIFWADKVEAFREIYRVLRPGGVAYIGVGDSYIWPRDLLGFMKMLHFRFSKKFLYQRQPCMHLMLSKEGWARVLSAADITGYRFWPHIVWIEIKK
jgi:ubiquinone/menaquinone biosynthesis C-methylase UbiE